MGATSNLRVGTSQSSCADGFSYFFRRTFLSHSQSLIPSIKTGPYVPVVRRPVAVCSFARPDFRGLAQHFWQSKVGNAQEVTFAKVRLQLLRSDCVRPSAEVQLCRAEGPLLVLYHGPSIYPHLPIAASLGAQHP